MGLELADIFRRYGNLYRQKYATRMPSTHLKAMRAIEQSPKGDNVGPRHWVGRCIVARIVSMSNTVTIPAATDIVPFRGLSQMPE
jgi:hypothetical protein